MDALKELEGKVRVYPSEGFSAEQVYKDAFRMRLKLCTTESKELLTYKKSLQEEFCRK
jgi:hypothetical protein